MFYIGIVPSRGTSRTKSGWQIIYFFKVSQNPSGLNVLEAVKKRFNCGYIKNNDKPESGDRSLAYVVRDLPSLKNKVIPFFDSNNLIIKKEVFLKFKSVIKIVDERKHLSKNGMKKVLEIAYSMNTRKRKVSKEDILKSYN